jgi:hypothetical protein
VGLTPALAFSRNNGVTVILAYPPMPKTPATKTNKKPAVPARGKPGTKAASKAVPVARKPAANTPVKAARPAAPKSSAPKPSAPKSPAPRLAAFWPTLAGGLALSGDTQASTASLTLLLQGPSELAELNQHLAGAMAAQFARATSAARRKAARGDLSAEAIEAAQQILDALKACAAAAGVIRAQSAALAETWIALAPAAQRKLQAELGKLVQAVLREPSVADVPALMSAALASALDTARPTKGKRARPAQ